MKIDETRVTDFLDGLGIALTGSVTTSEDFTTIPAKFRGVEVVVKIANQLNPLPQKNVVFREVLGRDGLLAEFGAQVWPRLVPLNELRVDDKPPLFVMPEPNLHVSMMITQPLAMKSIVNIDSVQTWMKPPLAVQEQWKIEIGDGLVLTGSGEKPSSKEAEEAQKVLLKWMSKRGK